MPEVGLFMIVVAVLLLSGGLAVYLFWAVRRRGERSGSSPELGDRQLPEALMERCLKRIHRLEARRQALEALIGEAADLKHRLAHSEVHRSRISLIDRSLRLLRHQAGLIDRLLGRYYRHHHELKLADEADRFQRRLEGLTEGYGAELLDLREEIDHLDGDYQRLILETEAQVEVENLLRTGN